MQQIVNVTPHAITFVSPEGEPFAVEPCGVVISATPIEEIVEPEWTGHSRHRRSGGMYVTRECDAGEEEPCGTCGAMTVWCETVIDGRGIDHDEEGYYCEGCLVTRGWTPPVVREYALVRTHFERSAKEAEKLRAVEAANPGAVIVGSIITAQAFPGRVLAMVPAPGFERVSTDQKRMRADKFTTF